MPFALFLVVKTPVSSTYVLNAVQKKPTKTSLAQSLSKLPLGLCSCPGKSYLETRSCKKTLTLRIPLRIYGQDGQEKKQAGWFGHEQSCKGKALPALTRPCFWSNTSFSTDLSNPRAHLWKQHSQLHLPFREIWLSQASPFILLGVSRLAKSEQNSQMFPPNYSFFFFSSCVCKFMEMLKESSAYLKLNKSLPQPVFKQICALEPSSCNFRFRDETYSFYLRRETRMSVSPNTSPGRDFLHIPSKNNSSSSKIMNKRFSLDVLNILPLK